MGLPVTARTYLPTGIAAICYRDEGRPVVLVSAAIRDALDQGRARREAFRRAREWGHDIVAITFEDLDLCRRRHEARVNAALRRLLSAREAS